MARKRRMMYGPITKASKSEVTAAPAARKEIYVKSLSGGKSAMNGVSSQ
jgi:hypothetical protein